MAGRNFLNLVLLTLGVVHVVLNLSWGFAGLAAGRHPQAMIMIGTGLVTGGLVAAAAIVGLRRHSGPDLRLLAAAMLVSILGSVMNLLQF